MAALLAPLLSMVTFSGTQLAFMGLSKKGMAAALTGGQHKQLEVGRALLLRLKVLLIDEPSISLSPLAV